jgi:hypothetical protein
MNRTHLVRQAQKLQFLPVLLLLLSLFAWTTAHAQITPLADSYISSADPTTNYGANTLLYVDGATETTYIQFNLGSIPSGASLSQASLKLYVNSVTKSGSFNVNYVTSAWEESTIDYSKAPTQGKTIASNVAVTTEDKNEYILVNVTSAVEAWLSGSEANNGIALVANSTFNATFDSKENTGTSHPAELDIVFAPGSGGGTITKVTAGTDLTGGGSSGNVTLNLNTAKVPLLAANNTFTGNNSFGGTGGFPIFAQTSAASGTAVQGRELATSGNSNGVYGSTQDPTGSGVWGYNSGSPVGQSALGIGVNGISASGIGVAGDGSFAGVYGQTNGGVNLFNQYGGVAGVYGVSFAYGNNNAVGVEGVGYTAPAGSEENGGIGVLAFGGSSDSTLQNQSGGDGIDSYGGFGASGPGGVGADGAGGRFFGGLGTSNGDGIDVTAGSGVAAFFVGDVVVSGTVQKSGGAFKIDDPLDPANKYLYHSFVESPDMKNIYDGLATLDANGESVIQMPQWFGVLNRDFRYQLTCIGGFAPVYIAEELANNQFKIGGGRAGMRVSWQITGIRQDVWANAHRIPVEEEKEVRLKGFYIHPELYGAPPEKQIEYARHPQQMKRMQENRQQKEERQAARTAQ